MSKRLSDDVDRGDVVEDAVGRYHVVISRQEVADGTRAIVTVDIKDPENIPEWVSDAIKQAEENERKGMRPSPFLTREMEMPTEGGTEGETPT